MKTYNKLIDLIKTSGKKSEGNVQTNSKGVKYQYVTYTLNTPFNWVVRMFEKAQIEVYGKTPTSGGLQKNYDFRRLENEKTSIYCEYSEFKGQAPRKISINELIILN